ncbi:NLE domain-containing protein [Entamoeba marina]
MEPTIQIRLINGETPSAEPSQVFQIPSETDTKQLNALVNKLQQTEEEPYPYSFYTDGIQVTEQIPSKNSEEIVNITYYPQAIFRCRPITRSTHTMTGHSNSILSCKFSQDSSKLATSSGDHTVRIWDILSCTPITTLKGHGDWVLNVNWHHSGKYVASGDKQGKVIIWEVGELAANNKQIQSFAHRNFISDIQWKPQVFGENDAILATASRDGNSKIYDVKRCQCIRTLGGHTQAITSVRWSGMENILFTSSRDRNIHVYDIRQANPIHVLKGHSHWVNSISSSCDYVLRQGGYDPTEKEMELMVQKKD